jgi:uncharacterized protein YodC (DUF2158 family)
MAMPDWKSGQMVRLKSGGPAMTVIDVVDGVVVCQWFERNKSHTGRFTPETLEELEEVPDSARGPFITDPGKWPMH